MKNKLKYVYISIGYNGASATIEARTTTDERIIIEDAEEILLDVFNEKGFILSKAPRQKINRAILIK